MRVCINGQLSEDLSVFDRAVAFGDGLFETCRLLNGTIPLWSYHQSRLRESCERLSINLDVNRVVQSFGVLLQHLSEEQRHQGVIKCIVSRGVGGRGYDFDDSLEPTVIVSWSPMPVLSSEPVSLVLCQQRLGVQPLLAGMKHLNRLENVLLKHECQQQSADDGLVMNVDGHVIETTHSNILFEIGGKLLTPRLDRSGVAGVMRAYVMAEVAAAVGVEVEEADLTLEQVQQSQGALVCNSLRGMLPVSSIGDVVFSISEESKLAKLLAQWQHQGYPQVKLGGMGDFRV